MQILTRWLNRIHCKPMLAALVTGVLLLAGSSRESATIRGASGEALSDALPAISAPFLHAIAPLVDVGQRVQRRAIPHDDTVAAPRADALPIVRVAQERSSSFDDGRATAGVFARGYNATAPPRLLN